MSFQEMPVACLILGLFLVVCGERAPQESGLIIRIQFGSQ